MPWDFALILFALGVLVPWRGATRIRQVLARPRLDTRDRLALYASTIAFQWLAVGIVIWRARARGLTPQRLALALPDPRLAIGLALGVSVLLAASQLYSLHRLARLPPDRQGFLYQMARKIMPQNLVETLVFVALAATVALCEEFLYRGFVFAVLATATGGSLLVAAVGSSVLFALAHLYQGRRGLASVFVVGLAFAGTRLAAESLLPSVAAHFCTDLIAGVRAPRLLAHTQASASTTSAPSGPSHGPGNKPSRPYSQ